MFKGSGNLQNFQNESDNDKLRVGLEIILMKFHLL